MSEKKKTNEKVKEAQKHIEKASEIIKNVSDDEAAEILGQGSLNLFLNSILKPKNDDSSVYDYLLENKYRSTLLAIIRHTITVNYSMRGKVNGNDAFVSPNFVQWFDDGVMFLQGGKRFDGLIGLYQDGEVKFAVAARDMIGGEKLGPNDFNFVTVEESKKSLTQTKASSFSVLEDGIKRLENLIENKCNKESEYQSLLTEHSWMFGAQYTKIDSHIKFDDANIPDFTGIRSTDSSRDIIEIKPPFINLFRKKNKFSSTFLEAWDQAERYLDFATTRRTYLYEEKGLRFENPKCFLLIGHNLEDNQMKQIRRKERNHKITVLTYNDVLKYAKNTLDLLKGLKIIDEGPITEE